MASLNAKDNQGNPLPDQPYQESSVATYMAAFMRMNSHQNVEGGNGNLNIDPAEQQIDEPGIRMVQRQLLDIPAFKEMMKDPHTKELFYNGDGAGLMGLMAQKQVEIQNRAKIYERPKSMVEEDNAFYKNVINSLKGGGAEGAPAQLEKTDSHFIEMMKQLEAVEQVTRSGTQPSGETMKSLTSAVQKYVNRGTKITGGTEKNVAGFKEAMCLLKRTMPEKKFDTFCKNYNRHHPKKKIQPDYFLAGRLSGTLKTGLEYERELKKKLAKSYDIKDAATLLASKQLMKGSRIAPLKTYEVDQLANKILSPGSAFMRAMKDKESKDKIIKLLGDNVSVKKVTLAIEKECDIHRIKTAQGHLNKAMEALTGTKLNLYNSTRALAKAMAAQEIAVSGKFDQDITNKGFKKREEELINDRNFQRLAERYTTDAVFRNKINNSLNNEGNANRIVSEYEHIAKLSKKHLEQEAHAERPLQLQPAQQRRRAGSMDFGHVPQMRDLENRGRDNQAELREANPVLN